MGCSFDNDVLIVCDEDEREWFNTLEDRNHYTKSVPASHFDVDCPVWLQEVSEDGKLIYISSMTYGTMDLSEVRLPTSCVGVINSVYSCQSQDLFFVEKIEPHNFGEKVWSPYGKLDIDFNFNDTLPKGEEDETDEEEDKRWETHRDKLTQWMRSLWVGYQEELGVNKPIPLNIN